MVDVLASQGGEGLIVRLRDLEAGRSALDDAGIASSISGDTLRVNVATTEAERVSRTLAERGLYVTELRPEEVDLETVFLELTRDQGIDRGAGVVMNLIRSELLRIWSRRMVKVLAIVAILGATAGVAIGAIQSHPPDLVTAQRNFDDDLQHCLAGEFVPEDQLPPGETLEGFCADNVRLENYVNNSLRLSELSNILKGTSFILIVLGLVIGASSVGADWQVGTMAALLTWEPRRLRDLPGSRRGRPRVRLRARGRLAVVFALALAARGLAPRDDRRHRWPVAQGVAGTALRIGWRSALRRLLGLTLAMIGRNTAAALGVAFGYLAIVECLLRGFIPGISESLMSTNLVVFVDGQAGRSETGSSIAVGDASITITLYAGVLLLAALALFRTRDVT